VRWSAAVVVVGVALVALTIHSRGGGRDGQWQWCWWR